MSVNVTVAIPIDDFITIRDANIPQCNTSTLKALIDAIQNAPYEIVRKPVCKQPTKKVSFESSSSITSCSSKSSLPSSCGARPGATGVFLSVQDRSVKKSYRLESTTTFGNLKIAYAKWYQLEVGSFGLWYGDRELKDEETPDSCGMKSKDRIRIRYKDGSSGSGSTK